MMSGASGDMDLAQLQKLVYCTYKLHIRQM